MTTPETVHLTEAKEMLKFAKEKNWQMETEDDWAAIDWAQCYCDKFETESDLVAEARQALTAHFG